jgi:hypothetical protein
MRNVKSMICLFVSSQALALYIYTYENPEIRIAHRVQVTPSPVRVFLSPDGDCNRRQNSATR